MLVVLVVLVVLAAAAAAAAAAAVVAAVGILLVSGTVAVAVIASCSLHEIQHEISCCVEVLEPFLS